MLFNRLRMRNRLLQVFYRPVKKPAKGLSGGQGFLGEMEKELDELDKNIEEKVTPLLSEFFD